MSTNVDEPLPFKFGTTPQIPIDPGLGYFCVEVSWGGFWLNLNDGINYKVAADSLNSATTSWRKITTTSPVTEGTYLIHAVRDNTEERLVVRVYGQNQNELNENAATLEKVFSQLDYRVRLTFDSYREYWRCQPAEWTHARTHTLTHNVITSYELTISRFPTITSELIA